MRYHNITKDDMLNGDGLRVVLWVAGCEHHCAGCQNPITWDPEGGVPFTDETIKEIFEYLKKDYCSGITYSGGDPLHFYNRKAITDFAAIVKRRFPTKTQWLYTGYMYEEISYLPIMNFIDVIVDGKFDRELADINYHWTGSRNQRVIDVKKTIQKGEVVLWDEQKDVKKSGTTELKDVKERFLCPETS